MPMIPEDEIDRIKRETDLPAVIRSRGVDLKPAGHDLVGLCPFHEDHDPSLRVTPGKGLWRCMSCGATGNVIQFIQRFDGVSFRHAFELLKSGKLAVLTGPPSGAPVKKATVSRLENPVLPDGDDQAALRQVLDYYHERLKENPTALAYLAKRGLRSEEVLKTFKIGFVDRTLGLRLPHNQRKEGAALRERLTRLGLLRDTGHEHLRGRIVFPVIGEDGRIGTVYGRAIDDGGKHDRHLFLPGPQRGIFNPAALRSADERFASSKSADVIVTEGIIDALTWWCAGFRNVTTGYSAKALPEELLDALIAAKTQRVFLSFDRDEAGDKGAAEAAAQLAAHGIEVLRVMFPPGFDANRYAVEVTPADQSLGLLLRSALPLGEQAVPASVRRGVVAATSKTEVSSLHTYAPPSSSLAAKAAPEAAKPSSEHRVASSEHASDQTSAVQSFSSSALPPEAAKEKTAVVSAVPPSAVNAVAVLKDESDEIELEIGDRRYRIRGLAKNTGFESLRVSLRVLCGDSPGGSPRWHLDTLDLCSARQRDGFIAAAAGETALKPELLKRDLGKVLLKLEELQEARLKAEAEPAKAAPQMDPQEREAALALLRDPKLLDRILTDFAACGIVGEETNKLVGYLAAVSRKLKQPLAIIVQSTTAAGKTALMEAVLAFVPPEERVKYSALTGQALYYLGDADLRHKILAIVEEEGAERASYALKLLQSEGELCIASTGKDPHTGRMVTQEYRVEGPVMIFLTTTAVDIDEELLNRCVVLTVDEGREQTAAIHRLQRERETLAGLLRNETRNQVLTTHRAAQRLLRSLAVVNPFAERLTFLDDRTRTRRDHMKYLALIRCITLLHQYQRDVKILVTPDGRSVPYVEVSLEDIAAANRLAHEVLGRCLDDMPPQTRRLLELLDGMAREVCATRKIEREDFFFSRRQVREFTGWGNSQLHVHLQRLVELEYLLTHRADHGQGFVYELVYDGEGKDGGRFLPGLLDVEKLRCQRRGEAPAPADARGESVEPAAASGVVVAARPAPVEGTPPAPAHDYDEKHPGVNGSHPAPIRPGSGANPGGIRPAENAAFSSEKPSPAAKLPGNAHLEAAALAVAS